MIGGLFIRSLGSGIYRVGDQLGRKYPLVNTTAFLKLLEDFRENEEAAVLQWTGEEKWKETKPTKQLSLEDLGL